MKLDTKTYLVGKNINTLGSSDIPQNALDITEGDSQLYHIIPSCAYIISNGIATPQEISFFLFKKENNSIQDITNRTKFVINYTINGVNGTFNLKSNKFAETDFDYSFSDITSLIVKAYDGDIEAAEFNIACVEQKSGSSSGTTGEKGEDGITFYVLPSIVTLQSNEDGIVEDSQLIDKTVQIIAYRGSKKLDNVKIEPNGFELQNAEVEMVDGSTDTFRFKHIAQHEINISQEDESASTKKTISYTSGYAVVKFVADKTLCKTTVPFVVDNTVLYTSYYERTNKSLTSQYTVYEEINQNISNYNTQIKQDAKYLQATADSVQQKGNEIETNYNNWKATAEETINTIQSKIDGIDGRVTQNAKQILSIDATGLKQEVEEYKAKTDGNAVKIQQFESTADGLKTSTKLINTYIGENGEKLEEKMGSYFKTNANEIVAGVFSDGTGTDAKESVMTLTDSRFGINLLKNGLNVAGFELADEGGNGEGTGSKFKVNADNITFEGTNAISLISKEVSASGNLSAKSLTTKPDGDDPSIISIEGSYLKAYNKKSYHNTEDSSQDKPNLILGTNNGKLQFDYYDDNRNLIWSLGQNGFVQYITWGNLDRKKQFIILDLKIGKLKSNEVGIEKGDLLDSSSFWYIDSPGQAGSAISGTAVTCYQYVAPNNKGAIMEDKNHSLSSEEAAEYNYKWFCLTSGSTYNETNISTWNLKDTQNIQLVGSDSLGTLNINKAVVESGSIWQSVSPISNDYNIINIGSTDIKKINSNPTSQDNALIDAGIIYCNSVSQNIKS